MHSAPSVSYPVGRSLFYAALAASVWLAALGVALLWCYQVDLPGWRQGLMLALWLGTGGLLLSAWRRSPGGLLRWDGESWWWETARGSVSGSLAVHLDGQQVLLASLRPQAGALVWLWLERRSDASNWNALRRAACSPGSAGSHANGNVDGKLAGGEAKP
jgi:toxin CptA